MKPEYPDSIGGYKIRDPYGVYFLTFTTVGWVDLFTRTECKNIIIDSLSYCMKNKGLDIYAYVIMGSHIHIIMRAEENTSGLSNIIRDFKKFTSKKLIDWIINSGKESRKEWLEIVMKYHVKHNNRNSTYQLWQHTNQPKECNSPTFTWQKINYIHNNPVVSGIVDYPEDYRHSSARNYLMKDNYLLPVTLMELDTEIGYVG